MFQETCLISGLPISNNQQVVLMFLAEEKPYNFHSSEYQSAMHFFRPMPIVIKGTYKADVYCFGLYDITTDAIVQHAIVDGFRNYIKGHEHPVHGTKFTRGGDIDINNILSMAYHGCLELSLGESAMFNRKVTYGFILREVYDFVMDSHQVKVDEMVSEFYDGQFEYHYGSVYYEGEKQFHSTFNEHAMVMTPKIYLGVVPFVEKGFSKENDDLFVINSNYAFSPNAVKEVCEAYEAVGRLTFYLEQIRRIWTIPERLYSTRKIDSKAIHAHLEMLNRLTEKYSPTEPDNDD